MYSKGVPSIKIIRQHVTTSVFGLWYKEHNAGKTVILKVQSINLT